MKTICFYFTAMILTGNLMSQVPDRTNYQANVHDVYISVLENAIITEDNVIKTLPEKLKDYDGNLYHIVKIGDQTWMAENLSTTHYRNGDAIPVVNENSDWSNQKKGAWCNYRNDENYAITYGHLYNYYAVADNRKLCPANWHVPTDAEWRVLGEYLGGDPVAGAKLMEMGTSHWNSPNDLATNETGFTALPGGVRRDGGASSNLGNNGLWWSSSEASSTTAWMRELLYHNKTYILRAGLNKDYGLSVRCIKN
jgi:uncharacterized protein (TIGR02145 family)